MSINVHVNDDWSIVHNIVMQITKIFFTVS